MNRNGGLKILVAVLIAAVVWGAWTLTTAVDELRRTNLRLIDEIRVSAAVRSGFGDGAEPGRIASEAAVEAEVPGANARFFDAKAERGGRIVHASVADTQNLNMLVNNDAAASEFFSLCNDTLGERDYAEPERFEPLLAESWTVSDDHRSYRIKLRRGVRFHDFTDPETGKVWKNREVTAADFKFFVDVIKNPKVNCSPLRVYYQDLESIEVVNDYEFIVRWSREYYGSFVSTMGLMPLPRHFYADYEGPFNAEKFNSDHLRNRMIVGCGPYRFVRWDKDARVLFEAFDGYYGRRLGIAPPLRQVAYELIRHPGTRFQALQAGDLDILGLTPEQYLDRTGGKAFHDGTFRLMKYPGGSYSYIGYNQKNELFRDKRVRRALTMLVDREKILQDIYRGCGRIVTGPFRGDSKFTDPAIRPWPFDVAEAKKLLSEAGWRDGDGDGILEKDGRKFEFTILQVASHPIQEKMLPMIQQSMAKAGVAMKIQNVEWSVYVQKLENRDFEVCTLGWTSPLDPDPYQVWHSSQIGKGGSNFIGFSSPEADRIIEELRVCFDPARRIELARQFGAILHEEQPYTFLFEPDALVALSGRYENVRLFSGGLAERLLWTPKARQRSVPGF